MWPISAVYRRLSTLIEASAPDIGKGVRAAIVTVLPFMLAVELQLPALTWMALGGWLGTLADPGGSRATRARALFAFAVAGAALVWVAEMVAPSAWLATAWLALTVGALALLRAIGGTAGSIGTLLMVATTIAAARVPTHPSVDALSFIAGALQAVILSSVVWPVWTHLPVRRAVASVYGELAAYAATAHAAVAAARPPGDERWNRLIQDHHQRIRNAIEAARSLALAVRARRDGETLFGGNVRALLGAAEAQFPVLVTFVQELEALPADERAAPAQRLTRLAALYNDMRHLLAARIVRSHLGAGRRHHTVMPPPGGSPADLLGLRLENEAGDAMGLLHAIDEPMADGSTEPTPARGALRRALVALRDALAPRSVFLHHALRTAAVALVASAVGRLNGGQHSHWVTLTALLVLQPDPGATIKRAGERVVGTILGCMVAIAITVGVRTPLVVAALLIPLSAAAVATRPRSYRLFTFFITPVFVLLAEQRPGDWSTAAERVEDVIIGGFLALIAAVVVFPASERQRLPDSLAAMIAAVGAYAAPVLALPPRAGEAQLAAARRTTGIALGAAQSSLERLLSEPRRDEAMAADAMLLVTYTRRLSSSLTSVATLAGEGTNELPASDRAAVAAYLSEVLRDVRVSLQHAPLEGKAPVPPEIAGADPEPPALAALRRVVSWGELLESVARPG